MITKGFIYSKAPQGSGHGKNKFQRGQTGIKWELLFITGLQDSALQNTC